MKKLTFFVALLVSLNASVVVRKQEEGDNQATVVKDYSVTQKQTYAMWLQNIVQNLSVYFYGISKDGDIQAISWDKIQQILNRKKENQLKKISKNRWLFRYHEQGEFD